MRDSKEMTRRRWLTGCAAGTGAWTLSRCSSAVETKETFRLRFILASAMFGYTALEEILPEVKKTGAGAIDIWPKVHGNQREQVDRMGVERFEQLLKSNGVRLGASTCYQLGPFKLGAEMKFAERVGGRGVVLVSGARGPKDLKGSELKTAVRHFAEQMKPHAALAEQTGCVIAIENHANSLIDSPDSIRWFGQFTESDHLGVALAPHHLPQDAGLIASIADDLGSNVKFFYAQQHGMGSTKKRPKQQELLQMPGRGPLDFTPILAALKKGNYRGYTEIFMHPVPRGVPILGSTGAITREINRARDYLVRCIGS